MEQKLFQYHFHKLKFDFIYIKLTNILNMIVGFNR